VKKYRISPEADDDLREIWRYLLEEAGLAVADRIQDELVDAFAGLSDFPGKGHKRGDLTSRSVLFFSVYQYMIVDRRAEPLEIVAVIHGKRNVKDMLARI
jgi:plasmid stabilization system protein ParE